MPQMKYIDLHCDTLTVCADRGADLKNCGLQTDLEKLNKSGCAAQCFAIFTQGTDAASCFKKYVKFFKDCVEKNKIRQILDGGDIKRCLETGETGAILTVENLGFIGEDLSELESLSEYGVKMASLVWNYENDLAYPNLMFSEGEPQFLSREGRGLKDGGRRAAEILDDLKIIIDISHLSDGGADELLCGRKKPLVASHSNAAEVLGVSRNLTDGQIKKIADCGGVVGVNFCKDFLGGGAASECVLNHIRHIIKTGGEDVVALGGDFDGIPPTAGLEDCLKMPDLFSYLENHGITPRVSEKLRYANFLRVFEEVCG